MTKVSCDFSEPQNKALTDDDHAPKNMTTKNLQINIAYMDHKQNFQEA